MYYPQNEPVIFERDCDAVLIPMGEKLSLPEGTSGFITQALGGSFTVYVEGNLFRIAGVDADAVGKEPIRPPEVPENATEEDIESVVWQQLRTCFDPEIPINVVELGLVYECNVTKDAAGDRIISIKMTLTAPGCGMGPVLMEDVREKLEIIPTVAQANVELVFDPPWNTAMMSEAARLEAGLMQLILYLIRHAKSSWHARGLADHKRPLNQRGIADAPRMFERLRANTPLPELIISSDAVRASATAQRLVGALEYEADRLTYDGGLYHAGIERIVDTARNLPDTVNTAALVGHNPGMTYAANALAQNLELDNLPTCGIVGLEFDICRWRDLETGIVCYFDYPKNADGPLLREPAAP